MFSRLKKAKVSHDTIELIIKLNKNQDMEMQRVKKNQIKC